MGLVAMGVCLVREISGWGDGQAERPDNRLGASERGPRRAIPPKKLDRGDQ